VACAPLKHGALLLELAQHFLPRHALPLERGLGVDESGPLLLKLAFRLLACGSFLPELLLRRGERVSLVCQGRLQPLGLLEGRAAPLELGADGDDLGLPRRRDGAPPSRSSRARRKASSRSTSAILTLSTAEAPSAAWAPYSRGRTGRASTLYASHRSDDLRASTRASRASYCPQYQ
jgi:hypothetical protein